MLQSDGLQLFFIAIKEFDGEAIERNINYRDHWIVKCSKNGENMGHGKFHREIRMGMQRSRLDWSPNMEHQTKVKAGKLREFFNVYWKMQRQFMGMISTSFSGEGLWRPLPKSGNFMGDILIDALSWAKASEIFRECRDLRRNEDIQVGIW